MEKNYSDLDIQLSGLLYLYLIYKSSNNTDGTRRISDIYADRKKTYLKVTQRWRTLSRDMQVMDNFLQNDIAGMKQFLQAKTNIPLLKQILEELGDQI